jgi:protein MBA1
MYEAVARGDKLALKKVCGEHLASRFSKAIDARPAGRRYGWELVKYNSALFWPRVLDNKIIQMGADKKMGVTRPPVIRQVVVGIMSRQRRWEVESVKGKDRVVEGSEKEQDVTEYVVLNCAMDRDTWIQGDWRIIGTTSETTPEKWREAQQLLQDIESLS